MDPQAKRLLEDLEGGDRAAQDELWNLVYGELRALASRYLRHERGVSAHDTASLVNEAYLRLVGPHGVPWKGRAYFYAAAAEALRRVLVDRARRRASLKRGGAWKKMTLPESVALEKEENEVDLLALDDALAKLRNLDERQYQVVVLRFFGNLEVKEIASVLGVSERTVKGDWRMVRAWLRRELAAGETG